MSKKKDVFEPSVSESENELEATGKKNELKKNGTFKKTPKNEKRTTTIVMTNVHRLALKRYCVEQETNFSEVIAGWIEEHCKDFLPK